MVRREPCYLTAWITIIRAHIAQSQMARTFMCSQLLPDTVRAFSLLAEIMPTPSWTAGCQGLAASRCICTLDWQMAMMYLSYAVYLYILSHHPPDETGQFPCNRCYRNTLFLPMANKLIISASQPDVCFVCIGYDSSAVSVLPCFQIF